MAKSVRKPVRGGVPQLFSEHVLCGGLLYSRKQLFDELLAEGFPSRQADALAFGYLVTVEVTPELLAYDQAIRRALDTSDA